MHDALGNRTFLGGPDLARRLQSLPDINRPAREGRSLGEAMNNRIDAKKIARTAILTIAFVAIAAGAARAQEYCESDTVCFEDSVVFREHFETQPVWSTSGAVGVADEGSQNSYAVMGGDAYIRSNKTGSVILRYPVRCEGERITAPHVGIRYKDDGSNARVVARLIETDLYEGGQVTRSEFDSNSRPSRSTFQTYVFRPDVLSDEAVGGYTFYGRYEDSSLVCSGKAYHFEVRLTRGPGGDPRLRMLSIEK